MRSNNITLNYINIEIFLLVLEVKMVELLFWYVLGRAVITDVPYLLIGVGIQISILNIFHCQVLVLKKCEARDDLI